MRYQQRFDEEGWEVSNKEIFRIACCDCGLVHDLAIFVPGKNKGAKIGIAARRNKRATSQRRRVLK